ncbi:MAG TPA: FtsQ-type POTRA domain-containing protein, partial [Anaerolineae bacterium]|nr:FtsQ-type POTRA domain-containing protein [Anaerolineae bacterium]
KLAKIRRNRQRQLAVAAAILLFILIGGFQLYKSGLFNITRIDVSGNKFVPSATIKQACDISKNSNLLTVSTSDIGKRLRKNPWIKDVTIKRRLIGTLIVEVKERTPIALVSLGGKFYLIDDDLFVLAERQYADGTGIPTITDLAVDKITVGDRAVNDSLANAIRCLKSMDPSFRKTITLLAASSVDKLSLYNKDDVEILYGEAKQAEKKNKVLQTILEEQGRQVILIDIRNFPQSDPVIKRIDLLPGQ